VVGLRIVLTFSEDEDDKQILTLDSPPETVEEFKRSIESLTNKVVDDIKLKDLPLTDKHIPLLTDLEKVFVKFK